MTLRVYYSLVRSMVQYKVILLGISLFCFLLFLYVSRKTEEEEKNFANFESFSMYPNYLDYRQLGIGDVHIEPAGVTDYNPHFTSRETSGTLPHSVLGLPKPRGEFDLYLKPVSDLHMI